MPHKKFGVQISYTAPNQTDTGSWTITQLVQKTKNGPYQNVRPPKTKFIDYFQPTAGAQLLAAIERGMYGKL